MNLNSNLKRIAVATSLLGGSGKRFTLWLHGAQCKTYKKSLALMAAVSCCVNEMTTLRLRWEHVICHELNCKTYSPFISDLWQKSKMSNRPAPCLSVRRWLSLSPLQSNNNVAIIFIWELISVACTVPLFPHFLASFLSLSSFLPVTLFSPSKISPGHEMGLE